MGHKGHKFQNDRVVLIFAIGWMSFLLPEMPFNMSHFSVIINGTIVMITLSQLTGVCVVCWRTNKTRCQEKQPTKKRKRRTGKQQISHVASFPLVLVHLRWKRFFVLVTYRMPRIGVCVLCVMMIAVMMMMMFEIFIMNVFPKDFSHRIVFPSHSLPLGFSCKDLKKSTEKIPGRFSHEHRAQSDSQDERAWKKRFKLHKPR